MRESPSRPPQRPTDPIAKLIGQFSKAEAALRAGVSDGIDSVLLSDGRSYILNAAQMALDKSLEAQAQLGAIIESSADAIIGIDLQGTVTTWNASSQRIFGYRAAEMIGNPIERLIPSALHGEEKLILGKVSRGSSVLNYETLRRRKDGRLINVSTTFSPIKNTAGVVIGVSKIARDVTERRRTDAKLRNSEALINIAGQIARLGGWSVDLSTSRVVWSNEVCAIHDMPAGTEPTKDEAISYYAPEWRPAIVNALEECARDGTAFDLELEIITAKGRRSWVRAAGIPDRTDKGDVVRVQGAFQDIDERKKAEIALKRTNRALRMLSRCNEALTRTEDEAKLIVKFCQLAVDVGGYRMARVAYAQQDAAKSIATAAQMGDTDGYIAESPLSWSEESEMGNGPAGRAIRTCCAVVVDDAEKDESMRPWIKAFLSHGYRSVVTLPLHDDGLVLGILVLYSPQVTKVGPDEVGLLQELADNLAFGITSARARVEKIQSDSKMQEQAALLDKAQDAILVRDLDQTLTYWNKSAERLYGWSAGEAIGQNFYRLVSADPSIVALAEAELYAKGEWCGEINQKTKAGLPVIVRSRWTLVRDKNDAPRSIMSIITDITEGKKLEEQLLRAQRVESIGTLASGIAHDLNNVLAPILMAVGLLKTTGRDEDERRVLDMIEISAKRGADMVKQVLAFARGVEGQHVPTKVSDLFGDIAIVIREIFPKSIRFATDVAKETWSVIGDPTQLHQVLLNLCVNARDAMPGGGSLSITAENILVDEHFKKAKHEGGLPGPHVLIQVADTGTGIPPEIIEKIFDPFFTTKDVGKGTGLGLSTVSTIVKGHNGFVRIDSSPGKGTTFKIYLPAKELAAPAKVMEPSGDLPHGHGERILVVDDEASVRAMTQTTLEAFGYKVLTARNGVDGVALYAERGDEIALVITDMTMPMMGGSAMIHALLKLNPYVRIIAASGLGGNGSVAKDAGPGARHFMMKPYTVNTMLKTVERALSE